MDYLNELKYCDINPIQFTLKSYFYHLVNDLWRIIGNRKSSP